MRSEVLGTSSDRKSTHASTESYGKRPSGLQSRSAAAAKNPPHRAAAHDGALASGPDVIYGVDDITFIGIQPASAARRLDAEEPYWAWRLDPRSGARRSHGSSFEQSVPHPEDTFNAAMGIPLGVPPLRGIPAPTEPRRTAGA